MNIPAFPTTYAWSNEKDRPAFGPDGQIHQARATRVRVEYPGMTLRDYFAAKALAGFLANPQQDYAPLIDHRVPILAKEAYRMADEMLKAGEA